MTVYLLEDDENIQELITYSLDSMGFAVKSFKSSRPLYKKLQEHLCDIILLDIMIAGANEESGIEVIKKLKSNSKTRDIPVIFITAKSTEIDKARGLDLGADDYITKPFGVLELAARIKAVIRRCKQKPTASVYEHRDLVIDLQSKQILKNGAQIKLTFKEFELLVHLYENIGIVNSRDTLLDKVWGQDFFGDSRTVDVHIRSLRQKLGDSAENPKYIQTMRGFGYKLIK